MVVLMSKLKKKIILEYIYIVLLVLLEMYFFPVVFDFFLGDNKGIDGIGEALALGFIYNIFLVVMIIFIFIINLILILRTYKNEYKKIILE